MNLRLQDIPVQTYAQEILPLTEGLWGHGRSLDEYRSQTTQIAQTAYGRKFYRLVALSDGDRILSSFKRYEREARAGNERLRSIGIGAVFTPETLRGQGFASAMLAMALDDARAAGFDFAFLFSDIRPQFYKDLGFVEAPSRAISFRAESLQSSRIDAQGISEADWGGIRACFERMSERAAFGFTRSPAVWSWIRARMSHDARQPHAQPVNLTVRRGRAIAAYLLGRRKPLRDTYVVDELAFRDDEAASLAPALLRFAAGDLRRISGWLPPAPARDILPRGAVRKRRDAIWMIAAITKAGTRFLECALGSGAADGVWTLDHI